MATLCFGTSVNGNSGHDETDVLYIAFSGADAVPGADGADWNAGSAVDFENSLANLGDRLVQRIGGGGGEPTNPTDPTCQECTWIGHCLGEC